MDVKSVDALADGVMTRLPTSWLERVCPFHQEGGHFPTDDVLGTVQPYRNSRGPCAMRIATENELLIHAGIALFVSSAHYELATRERWSRFPQGYCDRASAAVMLSLLDHGYPNAVVLRADKPRDHSYVALPYAMSGQRGVIIADPTYGQMPGADTNVFVTHRDGVIWEYRPGWADGADLYPDMVLDKDRVRTLVDLHKVAGKSTTELRPLRFSKRADDHKDAIAYFTGAFSNPIDIPIPSLRDEILKKLIPW